MDHLVLEDADVRRLCMAHFISVMLPELQKFRDLLKSKGIPIGTCFERGPHHEHLRAQLLLEYPPYTSNVLDICYHYRHECLVISGRLGEKNSEASCKVPLADLNELTQEVVYKIIESFVTTVFNEISLCEFVTEAEEEI